MTDELSPNEAEARREAALKKMLATPPKPFTKKAKTKLNPARKRDAKTAK